MKKLLLILVVGCLVLGITQSAYACWGSGCKTDGNVMDSNTGNAGYILTYDCRKGNTDVGKWVDPSNIPELKGEKGDKGDRGERGFTGAKGDRGERGLQGFKGDKGERGFRGATGQTGTDGINGQDGTDGKRGKKGKKGDTGNDGTDGEQGEKGNEGEEGKEGNDGEEGKEGEKGEQGLQGLQGKGLDDPLELQYEAVIKSWKRVDLSAYYIHDFNNDLNTIGVKIKHYWGKSWSERELEKVNVRLEALENIPVNHAECDNITVVPTDTGFTVKKGINF